MMRQFEIVPPPWHEAEDAAQLFGQPGQIGDLAFRFGEVLGREPVDSVAGALGLRCKRQKVAHLPERKAERAAPPDEPEALKTVAAVRAVVAPAAPRRFRE